MSPSAAELKTRATTGTEQGQAVPVDQGVGDVGPVGSGTHRESEADGADTEHPEGEHATFGGEHADQDDEDGLIGT